MTGGNVIKLSIPTLQKESTYQIHEASINQMTVVTEEQHSYLLTCSDDMWVHVFDCYFPSSPIASYYVGAQVTCVTGFLEGNELYIQCTDFHGEVSVLKTEMQAADMKK